MLYFIFITNILLIYKFQYFFYRKCREDCKNHVDKINSSNLCYKRNNKSWKLRNDSSGVSGALHLDYFHNTTNQTVTSMPNTTNVSTTKKTLSSKHHSNNQHCLDIRRKPVKGCYCSELKKIQQKSTKTQSKSCSSRKCKSHILPAIVIENNYEKSTISSPISCETLRRVQKIDYTPKSQFLRNVRSKISLLQSAAGDCPQICSRSQCYHELMTKKDTYIITPDICKSIDQLKTENKIHDLTKSKVKEKYSSTETIEKSDKGIQVCLKKESKSSSTSIPCVPSINICSIKKTKDKICECQKENSRNDLEKCENSVKKSLDEIEQKHLSDKEMRDLNKFREKNYFDTHGSLDILVSSKSSGSLEQYFLNDRLFPERSRKIHKKDLVVTMPPCATTQFKRIHYFPRYIVHQEKSNFNTIGKKKRCQTCPLTGHAIDLGITKIKVPLNSLALKYQKRLP